MSIVVTGASGHLGRLVVESLLARGTDPARIVATARRPEVLDDLAARGVEVRRADYDDRASLEKALAGAERVLLVSGTAFGRRVAQHTAVIEAAVAAGASLVAYTSAPRASTTSLLLAAEHAATEEVLLAADVDHVLLRNAWYVENYTDQLPTYAEHGLVGATGEGRVSLALRREYAEAAAAVLVGDGHAGRTYELGGPAVTLGELAAQIGGASGREIGHTDLDVAALQQVLEGAGVPGPAAEVFADVDRGIAEGELLVPTHDLARLLGREPLAVADAVREALRA
ncbi:SDR family oxidoreductase [Nocardioides aurantiacus]|uniref:NAD(P)H dehydrogenase (Quinone) n=1 Tax=Nocardioides aurantiacus TaxID=86796 RepID=A0A3N2CXY4_9ACTN|nr:SDR family oxidoreductase [Nocardioides aurantiacus]ROR92391.1 NAD(P)H dehydrogenase (quinone) [Nocardioides aurantiacus]